MKKKILFIIGSLVIIISILVVLLMPKNITIFNKVYKSNIKTLKLNNPKLELDTSWINKISKFKYLETIDFGKTTIDINLKNEILSKYPNLKIEGTILYNFFNQELRDDIEELTITEINEDENIIDILEIFTKLKKVTINNPNLNNQTKISLIKKYSNIDFIWDINVLGNSISNQETSLDLSKSTTSIEEMREILTLLPKLTYLDMCDSNLSNEELATLREEFPNVKIAWRLHMGKWSLRTDDISFSVLVVKINYTRLTSEDIEVLKYCTDLQALDLGHQAITDISVIGDYLQDLRILILGDNKVKDITPLSKLKHLHYVELFVNKIEDFTPLSYCTELVDANIGYNPKINDITPLLGFKHLERLWIVNAGLTNEQMRTIKNTYSNATVNLSWALTSTGNGWREHKRYYEMIKMFRQRNYLSTEFTKYDNI